MKCVVIAVVLLASLSYGTGQRRKCPACVSLQTQPNLIQLECNAGNLTQVMCWENRTKCGRATINGAGVLDPALPRPVDFNATIWGCVPTIGDACSEDNDVRSELLGNIVSNPEVYRITDTSSVFISSFQTVLEADTTRLDVNTVCPVNGTVVGRAGSLRTDVTIVIGALIIALFAKQF